MIINAAVFLITYFLICACICLPGTSFSFRCQCLADCTNLSKWHRLSISLARTPKEWSVPPIRLAWLPPCFGQSVYPCLHRTQFAVIDSAPAAHTRILNAGQDFGNSQPSILNSPAPDGKICLCILVMGVQLN